MGVPQIRPRTIGTPKPKHPKGAFILYHLLGKKTKKGDIQMNIDLEKMEKAATDIHNAQALIGCLMVAVQQESNDLECTKASGALCWQLRGALEIIYNILDDATFAVFESNDILRKIKESDK